MDHNHGEIGHVEMVTKPHRHENNFQRRWERARIVKRDDRFNSLVPRSMIRDKPPVRRGDGTVGTSHACDKCLRADGAHACWLDT